MMQSLVLCLVIAANSYVAAIPPVVGPDNTCVWLGIRPSTGWICCQNRTLSVEDGEIVGRRHGVIGHCQDALQAEGTSLPLRQQPQRGLTVVEAVIVSIAIVLLCFTVLGAPAVLIYNYMRPAAPQVLTLNDISSRVSTESNYAYITVTDQVMAI